MRAFHQIVLALVALLATLSVTATAAASGGRPPARADAVARPVSRVAAATTQTVRFTVVPAILVVVDGSGRPLAVYTNLDRRPSAAELAAVHVRSGSQQGPAAALTATVRATLAAVRWGTPGVVWKAAR
jgi:hypothetical protein